MHSISGADIGIKDGTGEKPKAKLKNPEPNASGQPDSRAPASRDGTDTQSLIDLYF
jgi:hypothetical protein